MVAYIRVPIKVWFFLPFAIGIMEGDLIYDILVNHKFWKIFFFIIGILGYYAIYKSKLVVRGNDL